MARRVLALLWLAMAVGQVSDVGGFVDIVATYRVGAGSLSWVWAAALVVGEAAAGVGLLAADHAVRRCAASGAVSVAAVWVRRGTARLRPVAAAPGAEEVSRL